MASTTVIRQQAEGEEGATLRPAAFLLDAMVAVLEGEPDKAIALTPDVYVRAGYLVGALAPEALERARAFMAQNVEPQSISVDALDRIRSYTDAGQSPAPRSGQQAASGLVA